jgi:S1-C subfamily serine protease
MLFLFLSCLMSFGTDHDQTTFSDGTLAGHGSGNYFKVGKEKFILTAAHVVTDGAAFFILDGGEPVFLEHVYVDRYMDIAIMMPHRNLTSVKPINYRNNNKSDILGMSVNYTGYPSDLPKTSFTGVVSYNSITYAIMQFRAHLDRLSLIMPEELLGLSMLLR